MANNDHPKFSFDGLGDVSAPRLVQPAHILAIPQEGVTDEPNAGTQQPPETEEESLLKAMMADGGDLRTLQEYMSYRTAVYDSDCDVPEDYYSDDESTTEGDPSSDDDVSELQRDE